MSFRASGKDKAAEKVFGSDKCTAILVGAKASATGSPMTTHTADCAECDWRVNKVPAKDWPEGSMRPVYVINGPYPRQVREDRGLTWSKDNLEDMPQKSEWAKSDLVIGYIPQVSHTYALIEGMYGIMNEHQVAIGESTCAARFYAAPVSDGGKALLEVGELSQIALERSKTAQEAIKIMGELAMKYGYYSAGWDTSKYGEAYAMGEGGEALTVIDTTEAWMFHILPDDTGSSAIWVAQRIPEDHIAAVANSFVVREIIPDHPDFLYSDNLWSIAEKHGFWSPADGLLNFLKTYAPQRYHPNYSNRRVWRVLSLAAPDRNLPIETNAYADDYPLSIRVSRPEGPFSPVDIMWMQRDHFEGTPYSTAVGLAGGPFGDPNRFDLGANGDMTIWEANEGEFPRAISLFRTSYSFVTEPRKDKPDLFARMWFGQYAPDSTTYTPIYVQSKKLSKALTSGTMQKYDSNSAWWNFCVVYNYASRFYMYAMEPVRKLQHRLETELLSSANDLESSLSALASDSKNNDIIIDKLTKFTVEKGDYVSKEWKELFPVLLTTYRDGYIIGGQQNTTVTIKKLFYPKWWLETVGFFNYPGNKNGILFAPNSNSGFINTSANSVAGNLITVIFSGLIFFVLGFLYAKKQKKVKSSSFVLNDFSWSSRISNDFRYSKIPDAEQEMADIVKKTSSTLTYSTDDL